MYKKILLPTDGSEYAEKAEKHALFLAEASGAEILALSVVENSYFVGLPSDDTVFHVNEMLKLETEKNLDKVEKMKEEVHSDVKITLKVEEGSPADIILDTIDKEDIDLVVIGSSGKSGFDRFIMGSVADKVVKAAKCSVLVIH
ncbi:universal stress protein [Methanobrevibacter sp. OttesenSCG-928-K11]|nr:universal stress protein [Methanobrevibacter sp. OttesenSCG-928-K11]MDL2271028.1 universal stress protein [Methanobrevibacter sp. OttesenSCG-928-I08]